MTVDLNAALTRATALNEAGDHRAALAELRDGGVLATLTGPLGSFDPQAALLAANLYREEADFAQAETLYVQALAGFGKAHPQYAAALVELGRLRDIQDRFAQALRAYEQAQAVYEAPSPPDPLGLARCLQARASLAESLCQRTLVRECLTRARALIEAAGFPPRATAELLVEEAWGLVRVDGLPKSLARSRQAVKLYQQELGDQHPTTLGAVAQLGRLLVSSLELDEAAALLDPLVAKVKERCGADHKQHLFALDALALLRASQGDTKEAEKLARESLERTQRLYGEQHSNSAGRLRTLAYVQHQERRLIAARESGEQAVAVFQHVYGERHPQTAEALAELAEVVQAMGNHPEAAETLGTALEMLEAHPDDVRTERVIVLTQLGRLRLGDGDLDEARTIGRRCRSLVEELPVDPQLHGSARLLEAEVAAARNEASEADEHLRRAEAALRELPGHHPLRLEAENYRAFLARTTGDPATAVRLAREAVARQEKAGDRSPWLPAALYFLADQLTQSGNDQEAERTYERILAIQRRRHRNEHPDIAQALRSLAGLYLQRGNLQGAEVRLRQALDIRRNCLGDDHPETAESLHALGELLHRVGNLPAAESVFREAVRIREAALGQTHPDVVASLHGLALVQWGRGEAVEAVQLLEGAIDRFGEDDPQRLWLRHSLALIQNARGESTVALATLEDVLKRRERALGTENPGLEATLADLARLHAGLGDHLAARAIFERVHGLHRRYPELMGAGPLQPALDDLTMSDSFLQLGNGERGAALARSALRTARDVLPPGEPFLVGFLATHARASRLQRDYAAARASLAEAAQVVLRAFGTSDPVLASLWSDEAALHIAQGKPRQATQLYERAADLLRAVRGEDHPDHASARHQLGMHLQGLGEFTRAEEELRRYLDATRRTEGDDHPRVALALQALSDFYRNRGDLVRAEESCRDALDLVLRSEHPLDGLHAAQLHNLALLRRLRGHLDESGGLFRQAVEIDKGAGADVGAAHLDSQRELALVEAAQGKTAEAVAALGHVLTAQEGLITAYACLSPGPRRDQLLLAPWQLVEQILTLTAGGSVPPEAAFAAALRWKGMTPAQLTLPDRAALRRDHPGAAEGLDRLLDLNWQIAMRQLNGVGMEGLHLYQTLLMRWGEERERLESKLATSVPALRRMRDWRDVSGATLRAALPAGTRYIELVRYRPCDFAALCAGHDGHLPARYLAFVDDGQNLRLVDAGLASEVEAKPAQLRDLLAGANVVALDGPLTARSLGLAAGVQMIGSGRELVSPLLVAPPVPKGWLAWFWGLFGG